MKILTHSGMAHFDEICAISVVLAKNSTKAHYIERREPSELELQDPNVWCIDVGGRYEPALHNFDHHQDIYLPASFVQVVDYFNLDGLKEMEWFDFKNDMDVNGPFKTSQKYEIKNIWGLLSPLEDFVIRRFQENPSAIYDIMMAWGLELVKFSEKFKKALEFWSKSEVQDINGHPVLIGLTDDNTASQKFRDSMEKPASISVMWDNREPFGWNLYRFNDTPGVDFSRLIGHPDILFAHKGGFIAKTKTRLPLEEVLELIKIAVS